jgi:hypothetical protein
MVRFSAGWANPSRYPSGARVAGAIPVTGTSSTITPTSFQLSRSVKLEYSGWAIAVPERYPPASISARVYPVAGFAAVGNGAGGCWAITELNVTRVRPSVPSVQWAAVIRTVGEISVAEHRNRPSAW